MNGRSCPYFFVYGTLRKGASKDLREFMGKRVKLLGRATAVGRLYDLGAYPGMLEPVSAGDRVCGELYELDDVESTLTRLDEYEGSNATSGALFERFLASVRLDGGGEVEAWVYLYRGTVSERNRIASGDYFKR